MSATEITPIIIATSPKEGLYNEAPILLMSNELYYATANNGGISIINGDRYFAECFRVSEDYSGYPGDEPFQEYLSSDVNVLTVEKIKRFVLAPVHSNLFVENPYFSEFKKYLGHKDTRSKVAINSMSALFKRYATTATGIDDRTKINLTDILHGLPMKKVTLSDRSSAWECPSLGDYLPDPIEKHMAYDCGRNVTKAPKVIFNAQKYG